MIFQTTSGIRDEVHKFGCYYMAILWHAARMDPESHFLTVHDINHIIYEKFVRERWMGPDPDGKDACYVYYPEDMFGWLGFDVRYKGHMPNDRPCAEHEFEILKWTLQSRGWTHFVAGDGWGNTTYDPWGISETASHGQRDSKRVFEVVG